MEIVNRCTMSTLVEVLKPFLKRFVNESYLDHLRTVTKQRGCESKRMKVCIHNNNAIKKLLSQFCIHQKSLLYVICI